MNTDAYTVPTFPKLTHYPPVVMSRIAAAVAHDQLSRLPGGVVPVTDQVMLHSYATMKHTVRRQYQALIRSGLQVEWIDGDAYGTSDEMFADVENGTLKVRRTIGERYQDLRELHPMAQVALSGDSQTAPVLYNDLFRAVHDVIGHYAGRFGFGPSGEESAWLAHRATMTREALRALWCETRGQNTWTNELYSDRPAKSRPYAAQKVGRPSALLI